MSYKEVADKLQTIAGSLSGVKGARVGEEELVETFPFIIIVPRITTIDVVSFDASDRHIRTYDVLLVNEEQDVRKSWDKVIDLADAMYQAIHTNKTLDGLVSFCHVDTIDAGYKTRATFVRQFVRMRVSCIVYVA